MHTPLYVNIKCLNISINFFGVAFKKRQRGEGPHRMFYLVFTTVELLFISTLLISIILYLYTLDLIQQYDFLPGREIILTYTLYGGKNRAVFTLYVK